MIPTKTIINYLRENAKSDDFTLRRIMLEAAKRLEQSQEELMFTRQFIHERGLEFELASAWDKEKKYD